MREIKFRAWYQDKMWPINIIRYAEYDGLHLVTYVTDYLDNAKEIPASDVRLMQYTGLKDKNGKEIYEGDILDSPLTLTPFTVSWKKRRGLMWHNKSQTWSEYLGNRDTTRYEVIGNIYENPELLK